jgi:hypothetical protein
MKPIKNLAATIFLVVLSLLSYSFVFAQNRTNSRITQAPLTQIKGKQRVFVDILNETVKRKVEDFFIKNTKFNIVQNPEDAEIIIHQFCK